MEKGNENEVIKSDVADQEEFSLDQCKDLSEEDEINLQAFLMKVQAACGTDKSVPGFVGAQVDEWIKEIDDKNKVESKSAHEAIDSEKI